MYRMLIVGVLLMVMVVAMLSVCGCPKAKSVEEWQEEKPEGFVPPMPPDAGPAEPAAPATPPAPATPEGG